MRRSRPCRDASRRRRARPVIIRATPHEEQLMQIDAFTHFLPAEYAERLAGLADSPASRDIRNRIAGVPSIVDLDLRLRPLEEFGDDYRQIISLPAPPIEDVGAPGLSAELARVANDGLAELVRDRERFAG